MTTAPLHPRTRKTSDLYRVIITSSSFSFLFFCAEFFRSTALFVHPDTHTRVSIYTSIHLYRLYISQTYRYIDIRIGENWTDYRFLSTMRMVLRKRAARLTHTHTHTRTHSYTHARVKRAAISFMMRSAIERMIEKNRWIGMNEGGKALNIGWLNNESVYVCKARLRRGRYRRQRTNEGKWRSGHRDPKNWKRNFSWISSLSLSPFSFSPYFSLGRGFCW